MSRDATKPWVYLDHNSTTPIHEEVIEAMEPFLRESWANPSSAHTFGSQSRRAIDHARAQVAQLIGAAKPSEIIFTSGGSESNNTALTSGLDILGNDAVLITSPAEHAAVLGPMQRFEQLGKKIIWVPVERSGVLSSEAYTNALREHPKAVLSFMWANNETGVISPIKEMAEQASDQGYLFHTDAVQAVGKIKVDVSEVPVDMLSFSGHKLNGPKGVGVLYVREGTRFSPYLRGGHQERGRRAGTENVAAIVGLGKACELAAQKRQEHESRLKGLRNRLEEGIQATCQPVQVHAAEAPRLANTANISFEKLDGEAILFMLDDDRVCVSTGSACESGSLDASHVLKAMQVDSAYLNSSIRFSLGESTTEADIDYVLEVLPKIIHRCRSLLPGADAS